MTKLKFTSRLVALAVFAFALTSVAQAQATRTWVSGVGDDVNPCSRTAPCKTFAGAISKTFINGEIDALDPGGFGTLTITKSITVDGAGTMASTLAAGAPAGFTINLTDNSGNDPLHTVRLRNLSVNGTGSSGSVGTRTGVIGVRIILATGNVYLEDMVISDFSTFGVHDQRTTGGQLFIRNSVIRNNGSSGVAVAPTTAGSTNASIVNTSLVGNGNAGLSVTNGSKVSMSNSNISGNASFGIFSSGSAGAAQASLESCTVFANGVGVRADTGGTIRISNLFITNNTTGIQAIGGSVLSFGNNHNTANGTDGAPTGAVPANPQ